MSDSGGNRFFYGYIIVVAGLIVMSVMWSVPHSFGVFFKELSEEFSLSRAVTSGAWSSSYLLYGLSSMLMGRLTDKLGPRTVVVLCGIFLGLGYLLMSQVTTVWQMYLFLGLMGGLGLGAAYVPVVTTVARWFVKRRGTVTGIVVTSVSFGGLAGPIVANWLISSYGWRNAYIAFGATVMVVNIVFGQFLRPAPGDIARNFDNGNDVGSGELEWYNEGLLVSDVVRLKQFWLLLIAWFCFGFFALSIVAHIVPHVTDIGFSAATAAGILATMGGVGIASRIIMGTVSDRIGSRLTTIISISLQCVGLAGLLFAGEIWMFYLLIVVSGFGMGGCGAVISLLVAELFGRKAMGQILGLFVAAFGLGSTVGPILVGYIFDVTGNYQLGFLICLVLSIVALAMLIVLQPANVRILWSRR
ncbi:MFS transporter [Chloroflexota bacterium]